ncbi:hypothetical protein Q8F57_010995 [Paraburkholderia terrae]|uniref:hypothetical protein n=1 Tax=Paraburkholderia terrae TaxID=311230 RepID=UPI00296AA0C5|nr:hypothetical protein [Paraburkholderia terrae]MDW3662147.1 hypothetical protein [Paraburkholderia terrae]
MPLTERLGLVFLLLPLSVSASAGTNPECLKHLGGTGFDVNCYGGLTTDIKADSERIYRKLADSMPQGNANRKLLDEYMSAQAAAEKFCVLEKEAGTNWMPSPSPNTYNMWDGIYAECVYETRKQQNARLRSLLKSYKNED